MFSTLRSYFAFPEFDDFGQNQKARFLHITLLVIAGGCIVMGYQNEGFAKPLGQLLYVVSILCLLCVPLNKRGYYTIAAVFISILIFVVILFAFLVGVGVWDATMIAFPLYVIFTSFLFNRKLAHVTTLLSIGGVVLVYLLGEWGMLELSQFNETAQLVIIIIMYLMVGALLWVIVGSWERTMDNLVDAYDSTLEGWAKALEYRDGETEGHSRRVVELSVQLAREMGIDESRLEYVRRGARLHDIGKMAIPDNILLKPGPLDPGERAEIEKHPVYAREMLEKISFLKPSLDIPCWHHEHWDGSGYPEGLSGENIPLAARVFAVIDVWDALLSDRPYRDAWSEEEVIGFLEEQSGIMFDPQVVDAFLAMVYHDKKA